MRFLESAFFLLQTNGALLHTCGWNLYVWDLRKAFGPGNQPVPVPGQGKYPLVAFRQVDGLREDRTNSPYVQEGVR
jgi:hypothetical protein